MNILKSIRAGLLIALSSLVCAAPAAAQTVEYTHTDALGSVVAVTDANRNIVERREYEPYGYQLTPAAQNGPGYTGHVQDAATGLTYMQQRYYDPVLGRFLSVDPVTMHDSGDARHFNRYGYANNNPYTYVDPDGRIAETIWDVFNVGLGAASFVDNVNQGNYGWAAVDLVGLTYDSIATAVPILPAGASAGLKASRLADDALVVRGGSSTGANSVDGILKGTDEHPSGVVGFSSESANGASLCDLCSNVIHNQVGVTTVGEVRALGGDVISTSGRSPTHATVTGLTPSQANTLFTPTTANPVPKPERRQYD